MKNALEAFALPADNRRSTDTSGAIVSLPDLQSVVNAELALRGHSTVGLSVLRRIFVAPNAHNREASRYKAKLNVKLRRPAMSDRAKHPDAHAAFAAMIYVQALACEVPDSVVYLSIDDKARVLLGIPAAQRVCQLVGLLISSTGMNG